MTIQFFSPSLIDEPYLADAIFTPYRSLLTNANPDVVSFVETEKRRVIALILALTREPALLFLHVTPMHRRKGVGQRLLAALEAELAMRSCRYLDVAWVRDRSGGEGFAAFLQEQGWPSPKPHMILYGADTQRLVDASWMQAFDILPTGHAIVPWSDLKPEQLVKLRQAIRFESWVPVELVPFNFLGNRVDGSPPEKKFNLAYVVWGNVVGWNFAHRVDAQTVRVSCTFVHPSLQQQLCMLALWREIFNRLTASDYRHIHWVVSVERESMVNLNDKSMLPYLSMRSEILRSRKFLSGKPDVNQ